MNKKKKSRTKRFGMPHITLTPLIDAALTLLIIFIVTAPAIQNGIKIDLPHGKSKEIGSQQDFKVTLNKKGALFFNSYPVKKEELVTTVIKALVGNQDAPVYVKADRVVSYGDVIEIVDSLKQAGVKYVAMSTSPISKK